MFSTSFQDFIRQKNYPDFNLKAVFFDMDGVLIDSMEQHAIAWQRTFQEYNIPFPLEEVYMNEGRPADETINEAYLRAFGKDSTQQERELMYKIKSNHLLSLDPITPMPQAFELLQKVKEQGLAIYLVTGSAQPLVINNLFTFFPGIFKEENMLTALNVERGKPYPDPYLAAIKRSGLNPWEAVVIENAPLGVESAIAAGLFTIAINTGPLDPKILRDRGAQMVLFDGMSELYEKWDDIYHSAIKTNL